MSDLDDYVNTVYDYMDQIPEEVLESDELAIVDLGDYQGYRVVTKEQYEGSN